MQLPPELRVIHEPVRLRILGLLYRQTDLGFTALRDNLGLTAGNLGSHASRLVEAGLVTERDALTRDGFEKRFQITPEGIKAFEHYLTLLEEFLAEARHRDLPAPQAPVPSPTPSPKPKRVGRATLAFIVLGLLFVVGEAAQTYFSDASGSSYLGIGVAGALVALLAPLEKLAGRMLR